MAVITIYGKNTLKVFFPGTTGSILIKFCMKHQRPNLFIICAKYDHGLTLTFFTVGSNFATLVFTWENVTLIDSLEIIASCDLEFGKYSKLKSRFYVFGTNFSR